MVPLMFVLIAVYRVRRDTPYWANTDIGCELDIPVMVYPSEGYRGLGVLQDYYDPTI
jgi:hypothetical protein